MGTGRVCTIWRYAEEITVGAGQGEQGGSGKQPVFRARTGVGLGEGSTPAEALLWPWGGRESAKVHVSTHL